MSLAVNNISRCCPLNLNNRSSLGRSLLHHSTWVRTLALPQHQDSTAPNPCPGIPCHTHLPAHLPTPEPAPTMLPTTPQCRHPRAHLHRAPHPHRASSTSHPPLTSSDPVSSSQRQKKADEDPTTETVHLERASTSPTSATAPVPTPQSVQNMKVENRKSRNGSMNKEFKFPPASPVSSNAPAEHTPSTVVPPSALDDAEPLKKSPPVSEKNEASSRRASMITPSNIEVPAPPPVEKERSTSTVSLEDSVEDDVGDTVDIPLN